MQLQIGGACKQRYLQLSSRPAYGFQNLAQAALGVHAVLLLNSRAPEHALPWVPLEN